MVSSIRARSIAGQAIVLALITTPAWSQKPGGSAGGGAGAGGSAGSIGGSTPGTPRSTTNPFPRSTNTTPGLPSTGIYLSGQVVMDDGAPPPTPVTIERVCGATPRAQAYTDAKGRFSFQMGQTAGVMPDASEDYGGIPGTQQRQGNSGLGGTAAGPRQIGGSDMRLAGCELRASLPGFRSDSVNLGGRRLLDNPDVGTIVLHRMTNVEGTVISMTSLAAPKDAAKAYDKGRQALVKNKTADAEKDFQKAVDLYPKYATAWFELARIQARASDHETARKSLANALAADPKFMNPYLLLSEMAANEQNWKDLADTTDRLLKLDALDYPQAFLFNAVANLNLGNTDAAEKSARGGIKIDTTHKQPKLEQVLAVTLARKKEYAEATEHLRAYLELTPDAPDADKTRTQLAELERASGISHQAAGQPEVKNGSAESDPQKPQQ